MEPDEIRKTRIGLRMTQADLAEAAGVTERTVQRWEDGTRKPGALAIKFLRWLSDDTIRDRLL